MDVMPRSGQWWRRKWTLGSLMIAIAALGGIFFLARPLATPATIRAAEEVIRRYGTPGLDLNHYRAEIVQKTPSGHWQVDFIRVSGSGSAKESAFVVDEVARKFRFNPWCSLPPAGPTPTQRSPAPRQWVPTPLNSSLQYMPHMAPPARLPPPRPAGSSPPTG
jgi:hypothetical protein